MTPLTDESESISLNLGLLHGSPIQYGDITVMFSWNFAPPAPEAVMLLVPTFGKIDGPAPNIAVIELNEAWKWSRDHNDDKDMVGEDTVHRIGGDQWQDLYAGAIAGMLRLSDHDPATRHRIRGLIEDHLGDLVMVPPAPRRDYDRAKAVFTLTSLSSGSVEEFEIEGDA